jgi:TRAP-type C4-dicarboxylate transport system substrate-binding protein
MLVESVAKQGLHILGWWDTGFRGITNSVRPVVNPSDVEGLKLRTLPSAVQVAFFEKIGAIPTAMDWVEVMPSLQQNVIDGLEAAPSIVYPYRVYEAQSYYSLTHHSYEPVLLIMSVASENKLPPELAEAVAQAAATASTYQREINDAYNRDIMGELGKVIEINEVPEATIDSFREAAKSVYPVAFDSVGPVGKKAIETIQAMQ